MPTVSPVPEDMNNVVPHLVVKGASDAIAFYAKAFGAVECSRMPGADGRIMHSAIKIGASTLFVVDEFPEYGGVGPATLKGSPVTLHVYVPDVDATFAQAVAAGATGTMPPSDMFWGDRYAKLVDPFGHHWSLASRQKILTPAEMQASMKAAMAGPPG